MPTTPPIDPRPEARADRRTRAMEELLDVRTVPDGPPGVVTLEVRNLRRQSRYIVYVAAYPDRTGSFCGCEDFLRRDLGTCKHLESAFLWLGDHPEARAPRPFEAGGPLWSAVDARGRRPPAPSLPPSRRLRHLGAALVA